MAGWSGGVEAGGGAVGSGRQKIAYVGRTWESLDFAAGTLGAAF